MISKRKEKLNQCSFLSKFYSTRNWLKIMSEKWEASSVFFTNQFRRKKAQSFSKLDIDFLDNQFRDTRDKLEKKSINNLLRLMSSQLNRHQPDILSPKRIDSISAAPIDNTPRIAQLGSTFSRPKGPLSLFSGLLQLIWGIWLPRWLWYLFFEHNERFQRPQKQSASKLCSLGGILRPKANRLPPWLGL